MTTDAVSLLHQRMIEDMSTRKFGAGTQRGRIYSRNHRCADARRHWDREILLAAAAALVEPIAASDERAWPYRQSAGN